MKAKTIARSLVSGALCLLLTMSSTSFMLGQATAPAPVLSSVEKETAEKITVNSIKDSTTALTDPSMEGRGTGQPGGEKAANWIADKFKSIGLKPLGDKGSYLQKVSFNEITASPETSFTVGDQQLTYGADYAFERGVADKTVNATLAFIGYGIQAEAAKIDQLANANVSGKIVIMLQGPPPGFPKDAWEKQKAQSAIMRSLFQKGVVGFIFISRGDEEHTADEMVSYMSRRQLTMPDDKGYPSEAPLFLSVTSAGAEKIFAKAGITLTEAVRLSTDNTFKGLDMKTKVKISSKNRSTKVVGYNVAGYLEGSDAGLATESVVFSAHYDAYGKENGKVYFGAADNALGVAEMLAVAEAFSKLSQKPKRSMVFLAVTGEEYGLYGSKYWAKNPTWDIKKVAANLNLDGIGSEVYGPVKTMVGYGAEHSTIGAMLDDVAKLYGVNVIPDPMPDEKVFLRSDHYSFVQRGVPSLMLLGAPAGEKDVWIKRIKDWEKTDYHQPGDTIKENWAWEGPETVAEIMAVLGWRISESSQMPSWLKTSRFSKYDRGNSKEIPEDDVK